MEKKKLIEFIGSLFVAIIFISSYAAYGMGSSSSNSASKSKATNSTQLIYGIAFTNATITNYTNVFSIATNCIGKSALKLNETLDAMLANGSIAEYYQSSPNVFSVDSGNESANSILHYIYNSFNCVNITAGAEIELPYNASFYFGALGRSIKLAIPNALRMHSVAMYFSPNVSNINVSIGALSSEYGIIKNVSVSIIK
ncbi:MAG: hypothetical protein QW091_00970 [Candidatus Micrarchaeaceae archaeon]